jgi:UDP-galactopyranose mutase
MIECDYIVVGAGFTGATIARTLADAGQHVVVVERRPEVGGNAHDFVHHSGIRVHSHGPHYFRTSSEKVWNFVHRFSDFYDFTACVVSQVGDEVFLWPVRAFDISRIFGSDWEPSFSGTPTNFEEAVLAKMPRVFYEKFIKGYTEKQWGVLTTRLSSELAARVDVRADKLHRLKNDRFQGLPVNGYTALIGEMLRGIRVLTGLDYLTYRHILKANKRIFFTGPIDEFFDFSQGSLKYRGQQRIHDYVTDKVFAQEFVQVNRPEPDVLFVRTIEWKYMLPSLHPMWISYGTVVTTETPYLAHHPDEFEYPFPDDHNKKLYEKYRNKAEVFDDVVFCGRLGEYKYYDMDQAIARAQMLAERELARQK